MQHKIYYLKISLIAFIVFFMRLNTVVAEEFRHVLIIANSSDQPYQLAIKGFKDQLSAQTNTHFTELFLARLNDKASPIAEIIDKNKTDLIYSLGEESTELAMKNSLSIPIVATLILTNKLFAQAANITGVSLNYPLVTQFQWLKKMFPGYQRVALLFNPQENAGVAQDVQKSALQEGLELLTIPVETPKQMPYALEQLENNIDILLSIPDEIAMSPITAREVLLASFRNKVPLVGLSDNWVKSGALYALSWDYYDLGEQCAIQSNNLFKGIPLKKVHPESPRKVAYSINAKIAEHMKIEISETLLKNAKIIFN
ncbi:MAG: ABC transporter substrate-binding protein [Methylococcaceae bacterium]